MHKKIAIYLAGSIKKGHENIQESYWTDADMQLLKEHLLPYEVSFLNPAFRTDNLSDQRSVLGRDMVQVCCSDVVFVDARDRRGLGVGAEMMWAKYNKIPIVAWAPKDSHYHKSKTTLLGVAVENFIHPFVDGLSDKLAENLIDGAAWILQFMRGETTAKGMDCVSQAMLHYKKSQMHKDLPMQELMHANRELQKRVESLK